MFLFNINFFKHKANSAVPDWMALLNPLVKLHIPIYLRNNNMYGLGMEFWIVSEILSLMWTGGGGAYPGGSQLVSMNASIIRNNIYSLGVGIGMFSKILGLLWSEGGGAHHWGTHSRCHWMCLIIRNNNIYGSGVGFRTGPEVFSLIWTGAYPRGTHG